MKVLIDGRAFGNEGSSASTYLYNLIKNLFRKKTSLKYIVVLNSKNYFSFLKKNFPNIEVIYININNNLLWDNFIIPYYSLKEKANIIFFPKSSSCFFKIPNKKIYVTIHGMIYKKTPKSHSMYINFYWRLVGKIASVVAEKIIAVSDSDKKDLVSEGYNSRKIETIPIGINEIFLQKYKKCEENKILNKFNLKRADYLIQVGHITYKKNQLFTLEIFNFINKKFPSLKLIFVGSIEKDRNYYLKVKTYIREKHLENKVIFTGIIDQNKHPSTIPVLLKNSKLSLFPSRYEGFGIPTIEAIASGTVLISSNKGALPEVLGKCNVFDLDVKIWEQEILKILTDAKYSEALKKRQSFIINKYDWKNITVNYERLFKMGFKK